jgi:hypothetical protein
LPDSSSTLGIVASSIELPTGSRTWGHGGWVAPEEREALDWLTLGRLLGWSTTVGSGVSAIELGTRALVIACDPESLGENAVARLKARLRAERLLVVGRAVSRRHPLATLAGAWRQGDAQASSELAWSVNGRTDRRVLNAGIVAPPLSIASDVDVWATLDGAPALGIRRVGHGCVATLAFHPSAARDATGAASVLLRRLLVEGIAAPAAWLDFEQTLVLRMDDPGSAQKVYCQGWCYEPLGDSAWAIIADDLRRRGARISIGYTAGWVDDGDSGRGRLSIGGQSSARHAGAVHPSALVRYVDVAGHAPGRVNDYESEFRGIQNLRRAGLGEVELHGYTHMSADRGRWASADDRYTEHGWYRELGRSPLVESDTLESDALDLGIAAFERWFGSRPTTLIPPGDQFAEATLQCARRLKLSFVDSYYLALRDGERFCWCQHVFSSYLNEPAASCFDAGLPVVGYFHDYELSTRGVLWMTRWLDAWQAAGAARFMDFRELAAAVGRRVEIADDGNLVTLEEANAPALVRPLRVALWVPTGVPSIVTVRRGHQEEQLRPFRVAAGHSVIEIPPRLDCVPSGQAARSSPC